MKESTYKLILSSKGFTKPHHKIDFKLNRQIPSRSRMRLLQMNWTSIDTLDGAGATVTHTVNNIKMNGLMFKLNNVSSTLDYQIDSPNSTKSLSVLAIIPNSVFAVTDDGSYEPSLSNFIEVSSPITNLEIELVSASNENLVDSDISNFEYTLVIEISSYDCA